MTAMFQALGAWLLLIGAQQPARPSSDHSSAIEPLDRAVIESRMRMLQTKNSARCATLVKLFEEAGCTGGALQQQKAKGTNLPNVVCTLAGEADSVIIIGAHFDMAEIGWGAADNWSGAALLPSIYQCISHAPHSHAFVFIGFSAEERGLIGSQYYAGQMTREQVKRTRAMINLDTLGLSFTKVEFRRSDPHLLDLMRNVAFAEHLPISGVNADRVGTSDMAPFAKQGIPVLSVHSLTQETLRIIHSAQDNPNAIRIDDYFDTYRLLCSFLAALDREPE